MSIFIFALVLTLICIVACHQIASRRGANPVFWAVMGAVFGPFAIPFVLMSKPKSDQ